MGTARSDFEILVISTLALYFQVLSEAFVALKRNWWVVFVPVFYIIVFVLYANTIGKIFSGLAGGLILGLLQALCIANYLALVAGAVDGRKMAIKDIKQDTVVLIMPVIGVLFAFFIFGLLLGFFFQKGGHFELALAINLILVVVFNTIPEVTYINRGLTMSILQEALEFIKENVIEWFLPLIILICPIIVINPKGFLLMFASSNALMMPKFYFEMIGSSSGTNEGFTFAFIFLFALILTFYFMIFRGLLYKKLSSSSRRKRVYQFKFGV